uniref:Uncharacterized protein n=1 Tax=Triticum urartu TaxID=4572 RepID=A0A8R7K0V8_TRIUA
MGRLKARMREAYESNQKNEHRSICLHSFSDLSHVSAATFMYLLKDCYFYGILISFMLSLNFHECDASVTWYSLFIC